MAAFSDRQASILSYCRIDDPTPEDLALLESFHAAAVSYLLDAGVAEGRFRTPAQLQHLHSGDGAGRLGKSRH